MKKYRVIKMFTDLQDNKYAYNVGNTYPREGIEPTESRIAELSGKFNKQGVPLIKAVEETVEETTEEVTEDIPEAEETEEDKPKKRTHRKADEE